MNEKRSQNCRRHVMAAVGRRDDAMTMSDIVMGVQAGADDRFGETEIRRAVWSLIRRKRLKLAEGRGYRFLARRKEI